MPTDFEPSCLTPDFTDDNDDLADNDPDLNDDQPPTPDVANNYISAELLLPLGKEMKHGRVVTCNHAAGGTPIGQANNTPILNTRVYTVKFDTANLIAECVYLQYDPDGNQYQLLDTFVDFIMTPTALTLDQQMTHDPTTGQRCTKKTTKGWKFCCQW